MKENKNTYSGWIPDPNDTRWVAKDPSKFYDEIVKAANILAQNKNKASYIVTTGKCSRCGAKIENEKSPHNPKCIFYYNNQYE